MWCEQSVDIDVATDRNHLEPTYSSRLTRVQRLLPLAAGPSRCPPHSGHSQVRPLVDRRWVSGEELTLAPRWGVAAF